MRYIKKGETPQIITDWINLRNQAGQPIIYNEFDKKNELNSILRKEQRCICCYCQRPITHYAPNKPEIGGAHNEHLYPENRPNDTQSLALQMDYTNLFACCVDSKGHKKKEQYLQYCGESKGNKVIRAFIREKQCASFFRYTINGEIIPNGEYGTWREYEEDTQLFGDIKDAKESIDVLNLNCPTLVNDRKELINIILNFLLKYDQTIVEEKVKEWISGESFPSYVDMRIQYVKHRYPEIEFKLL